MFSRTRLAFQLLVLNSFFSAVNVKHFTVIDISVNNLNELELGIDLSKRYRKFVFKTIAF